MWQQATAPGTYTWEQAFTYCENFTLGGYSDWRLPNRNELQSIVDYSRYNPSIDTTSFPTRWRLLLVVYYLARTILSTRGVVYFSYGYINDNSTSPATSMFARCAVDSVGRSLVQTN